MAVALYPLSAFRAQSAAALEVFKAIRESGTQEPSLESMQKSSELEEILGYDRYEQLLDKINEKREFPSKGDS